MENKLEHLKNLIESKMDEDIDKMTAKDRLTLYLNLMEFYIPKMQRSNFEVMEDPDQEINIKYHYNGNEGNPKFS